jgi:catechol 2,3-dioxygenase-like lactoylglutathione lyase family enzyme
VVARTAFVDHIGLGVPDLAAAKRWYDELMPILGMTAWFPTSPAGEFNYGPDGGGRGTQIFFYQSLEPDAAHSRHAVGLQHLSFMVESRAVVREAHEWAVDKGAEVVHPPRDFPEYGQHYATFFLDLNGFHLEVVSFSPPDEAP